GRRRVQQGQQEGQKARDGETGAETRGVHSETIHHGVLSMPEKESFRRNKKGKLWYSGFARALLWPTNYGLLLQNKAAASFERDSTRRRGHPAKASAIRSGR